MESVKHCVNCITFRAAGSKLPSDISRNWDRIESIVPLELTHGVIFDPQDSSTYVIGLKPHVGDAAANHLIAVLNTIYDARDDRRLIAETACRLMPAAAFETHSYKAVPVLQVVK